MVKDESVKRAVSRIRQRAERQEDVRKLIGTFVDVGILPQLDNPNHQIFYGRRGTGKTHVLRVLESQLAAEQGVLPIYIDGRTLGSTAQFSDSSLSLSQRCLSLFLDLLEPIYNGLLGHIIYNPSPRADEALEAADELRQAISTPVKALIETDVTSRTAAGSSQKVQAGITMSSSGDASAKLAGQAEKSAEEEVVIKSRVEHDDKIVFPALHGHLTRVLELADAKLYLLFDEWSSLPTDLQPYLAEFLKRGFLPVSRAVLKIASLEYRSRFVEFRDPEYLGFELGADIATAPDLDDYYVFDRNQEEVTRAYADMLIRHLQSELPEAYLADEYGIETGSQLINELFTTQETFVELARACEGVVRDLINIFTTAFFDAQRRNRPNIDRRAIIEGARQWFEQDKAQHLDEELQSLLQRIVSDLIGNKNARSFLLPRELERHRAIQRLFDLRILHLVQRGYADKVNPGARYNIYTLDYGTYVDVIGTSKEPKFDFLESDNGVDVVVPFDDKRSIRRIIVDQGFLNKR